MKPYLQINLIKLIKQLKIVAILMLFILGVLIGIQIARGYQFDLRNFLEILYFISTPILVIIGAFGLSQIKVGLDQINVAKENFESASIRESYLIAIEQSNIFRDRIMKSYSDLKIQTVNKFFSQFDFIVSQDNVIELKLKVSKSDFDKEHRIMIFNRIVDFLNDLEVFSMYFANGIAKDEIGFKPLARSFCSYVTSLMPILSVEFKRNYYPNIEKLFCTWSCRISTERDEFDKNIKISNIEKATPIETIGCGNK